jgi:hypothetical protein
MTRARSGQIRGRASTTECGRFHFEGRQDMTDRWKMIYLARRNPALAAEEFPQAWREHSALGRQCTNVRDKVLSVLQCSRVLDAPGALRGASADYDGVNLMRLRDRAAGDDIWDDEETLRIMRPDEPRVFSTYVRDFAFTCREHLLCDGAPTEFGVIAFLRAAAGSGPSEVGRELAALPAAEWLKIPALGAARHLVLDEPQGECPAGYEYAAVLECWYASLEALAAACTGRWQWSALPPRVAGRIDAEGSVCMLVRVSHRRP